MKTILLLVCLAFATPILFTGCPATTTTLESGGAYTDPILAKTDRAILDASKAMDDFVAYYTANGAYLAQWPEVGRLAANISGQRDGWVKDAYAARDAYAAAAKAYRDGLLNSAAVDSKRAALDGALAVIANVVTQITNYQNAHHV